MRGGGDQQHVVIVLLLDTMYITAPESGIFLGRCWFRTVRYEQYRAVPASKIAYIFLDGR
jgi:hypothetical protein